MKYVCQSRTPANWIPYCKKKLNLNIWLLIKTFNSMTSSNQQPREIFRDSLLKFQLDFQPGKLIWTKQNSPD